MNAHVAAPLILSPQQNVIIQWARDGKGSAFIEAVAGAGKTTTLIELLKVTKGSVAFAAYNTKIANEIKNKVAKLDLGTRIRVGTFHSFGFGAIRRVYKDVKVDDRAKMKMTEEYMEGKKTPEGVYTFIHKLVSLAKQRAIGVHGQISDQSLWYDIIDHFDLAYEIEDETLIDRCVILAMSVLRKHIEWAPKVIDFDDMIYIPLVTGMRMWENDWVLVDEAQDTNPARRALARKMLRNGGRSGWVGDRNQSIYGFTGADSDAIDQIIRDFRCQTFPMTVTYRCPKSVVTLARTVVSHIEAHESAPDGLVRDIQAIHIAKEGLTAADAILCRNTKPLVELAYALIRGGVACHVEGKDIGQGLLKLVNRFKVSDIDELLHKLDLFTDRETQKLIAKGKEVQAEALKDRVETVKIMAEGCKTTENLRNKIMSMFQNGEEMEIPTTTLSTCHKAKGREWDRVFILGYYQLMPSMYARKDWQIQQEMNIIYVAVTRAKQELVLVEMEAK